MYLANCWAPCFTLDRDNRVTLESGSVLIAIYTAILHVLTFFYFLYIYFGGPTDQFYIPLFEFDLSTTRYWCIILVLYSLAYILSSYWLHYGVKKEIRFFYWPWLILTMLEIFFMFGFGYFMIYRYYHYGWAVFAWIINWSYSFFHVYMFYAIVSQYYYLKELQEPTFIILMA